MIKQLIIDLANDDISLSQVLTRSKLIAYKINNVTLKNWIKKESEGYEFNDPALPPYRKIYSEMQLIAQFAGGQETIIPFQLPETVSQEVKDTIYFHQIREPLSLVELQATGDKKNENGRISLPNPMMEMIRSTLPRAMLLQIQFGGGVIDKLERKISTLQYHNVITQTKNKLLDTLLDLETEFPNLENDYIMNEANNEKANSIITTNIYGGNAPVNIATGNNNEQINNINIENIDYEKLKSLNVEEKDIAELKEIVKSSKHDKSKFAPKLFGWLGSVGSSFAARGIYDNMPQITEYIKTFI